LVVRESTYSGGEFTLTLEWTGVATETVTLTEMVELGGSGSQQINMQTQRLVEGNPVEVSIGAEKRGDGVAALLLSTRQSIENGNALVIQSGEPSSREPVPFNMAALFVIGAAGLSLGGALAWFRRLRDDETKQEERLV
jgi:hypothetical protein